MKMGPDQTAKDYFKASCQNDDVLGDFAGDGHGGDPTGELAEVLGVNRDEYIPVRFSVTFTESGPTASVTVLAARQRDVGGRNIDSIEEFAERTEAPIPLVRIDCKPVPMAKFLQCFKRTQITFGSRWFDPARHQFNIVETIELDLEQ